MKWTLLMALFCVAGESAAGSIDPGELQSVVDRVVMEEMQQSQIPGVQVAIVENGRVILMKGYGYADVEKKTPVDPQSTVFRVGSVSKSVNATVVLDAVQRHNIDLREDVRPMLRELPLDSRWGPLTLFDLLSQTGGFNERLFGQHAATPDQWQPLGVYLQRRLPPQFAPAGKFITYNDYNTCLAAYVIQKKTGIRFEEYAARSVFRPLGMDHTTFEQVNLPPPVLAGLAHGYNYENGRFVPYARDYINTPPAAGLMTTAADMARYMIALLAQGEESMQLKTQFANHAMLPGRSFDFAETPLNGLRCIRKDGQASGFSARMLLIPSKQIGIFSAFNATIFSPGGFHRRSGFHWKLNGAILDRYFPAPERPKVQAEPPAGFAERARLVAGSYRDTVGSRDTIEKVLWLFDSWPVSYRQGEKVIHIGSATLTEIEPWVFANEYGTPRAAFHRADGHLSFDSGTLERIPWYAASGPSKAFLVIFPLLFLASAGLFAAWFFRGRRIAGGLGFVSALFFGAFPVAFVALMFTTDFQEFFYGVTTAMKAALLLPILAVFPGLAFVVSQWKAGSRLVPAAYALLAAVFLLWLNYWNLLGFRF